jgi:hypothetical protein
MKFLKVPSQHVSEGDAEGWVVFGNGGFVD